MNILFLTLQDFSSIEENGIYTDLMREFRNNNHKVYIISPTEKRKREQTHLLYDGKNKILKLQIGNFQKTDMIEKGISTLTLENKFKTAIKEYFSDIIFDLVIYSTPPITLQKAVDYAKRRDSAVTYLLLKDIFPQNAVDLGMLKKQGIKNLLYKYFRIKEKKLYRNSDFIGCMSEENVNYLLKNNPTINTENVEVCPNSIEPVNISINENDLKNIKNKYNIPNDKTVFLYGGNLGKPQGIDFIIECLKINEKNKKAYFVIVGSGTEYYKVENYFNSFKPNNSILIKQLPKEEYEILANSCDVGLIFLDCKFTIPNFPSRLLSYMQASMPVIAATDNNTDIGKIIEEGGFGYWCESKDVSEFNQLVVKLCDPSLRRIMGQKSREYLGQNYTVKNSYEIIMKHFNK